MAGPRYTPQKIQDILKKLTQDVEPKKSDASDKFAWKWDNEQACPYILNSADNFGPETLTERILALKYKDLVGYRVVNEDAKIQGHPNATFIYLKGGNWDKMPLESKPAPRSLYSDQLKRNILSVLNKDIGDGVNTVATCWQWDTKGDRPFAIDKHGNLRDIADASKWKNVVGYTLAEMQDTAKTTRYVILKDGDWNKLLTLQATQSERKAAAVTPNTQLEADWARFGASLLNKEKTSSAASASSASPTKKPATK